MDPMLVQRMRSSTVSGGAHVSLRKQSFAQLHEEYAIPIIRDKRTLKGHNISRHKQSSSEVTPHHRTSSPPPRQPTTAKLHEEYGIPIIRDEIKQKRKMQKNIETHNNAIRKLQEIISSLEILQRSLQKHQVVVRGSKGTTAVVGVVAAGLFFSPAFPVALSGMIVGAIAGVAGIGTSVGDWWKTRKTQIEIKSKAKEAKLELEILEKEAEALQRNLKIVRDVVGVTGSAVSAAAKANSISQAGIKFGGIADNVKVGSRFANVLKNTAYLRPKAQVAFNSTRTLGKVFVPIGAGIGVLDALFTAVINNPSLELCEVTILQLKELIGELRHSVKEMQDDLNNL